MALDKKLCENGQINFYVHISLFSHARSHDMLNYSALSNS